MTDASAWHDLAVQNVREVFGPRRRYVSVSEFMDFLGLKSPDPVYAAIKSGKIPARKIANSEWRIAIHGLVQFTTGGAI